MSTGVEPRSVAVVIPVWDDYVRWLEEAVGSVVGQGVASQVIVVDNASVEPVHELPGTTVVRAPSRLSTGAARNLGLEAVRAPLVVFLDADDVMLPESLSWLVEGLLARPHAAALGMARIEADTGRRHRMPRRVAPLLARWPRIFAVANAVWSLVPAQGTMIMRTEVVRAVGGYADRSHGEEDWVLGASLAWRGPIVFDNRLALLYRWRADSPGRPGVRQPLLANARRVRERLQEDSETPGVLRAALPVVALGQWTAILIVRPLFLAVRRLRGKGGKSVQ